MSMIRRVPAHVLLAAAFFVSFAVQADDNGGDNDNRHADHSPNEWFMAQRAWPAAKIDQTQRLASFDQALQFLKHKPAIGAAWTFVGPDNVGGRITDIQSSRAKPDILFAGTANGGVFRSTDGGVNFTPVFENQASMAIGAIAIDPKNPNTVWVGTGEANSSGSTYSGTGIYLSTDGGDTWQFKGLLESHHIGRIVIDPTDSQTVYIAALGNLFLPSAERGVYKTTDGGTTWSLVLHTGETVGAVDVAIDPSNPKVIYTALWDRIHKPGEFVSGGKGSGVYKSVDAGATWSPLTTGLPVSGATTGRIGIALAPSAPQTLYAIFDDTQTHFNGIYKTIDGGTTWSRAGGDQSVTDMYATYGWWFGNIRVDPTDPQTVYAVGFTSYKSADGGVSFHDIGSSLHADHHAFFIDPNNPSRVFNGNDGGFFRSTDGGSSWTGPAVMPITQFYSVAVDPATGTHIFGGAQDNGTQATFTGGTSDWQNVFDGDGFQVQIDPVDPSIVFAEYQYGALGKSTDGGHTFTEVTVGAPRANWDTPLLIDPNHHQVVYYGADKLYRSMDSGSTFTPASPDLSVAPSRSPHHLFDPLVLGTVTAIAVPKADSQVIYAGLDDGKVWVSKDAGGHWTEIDAGLPQRWVTGLAADANHPGQIVVTVSGYRFGEPLAHVFLSQDFGAHWTDIHGDLPEIPVNIVRLDPTHAGVLFVGTDAGAYATTDCGAHWQPLGTGGLPMSPITDLAFDEPRGKVFAATFGRSMYALDIKNALPKVTIGCGK